MSRVPAPGDRIAHYVLQQSLGEGATGIVHRATGHDGRDVALKILRFESALDEKARARFRREVRVARDLDLPHVASILDVGEHEHLPYLVMPFYERGSLARLLQAAGAFDLAHTTRLAAELGRGLDALHERGILHRDVKPSNVLLGSDGSALLADFGLARAPDSTRLTEDGQLVGTPHYLAPELIEGNEATRASDLYALGCVLYECVIGQPPFGGRALTEIAFAHLVEAPVDPAQLRPDLPADVGTALLAALEKDPSARPTSATALARMLHVASRSLQP